MACSISAPENPSLAIDNEPMSNAAGSCFLRRRWIRKIASRSDRSGRSTKKTSSKRPFRRSSGGTRDLTDELVVQPTCVELQQRLAPRSRDDLCGKRLPASLDADEEYAARSGQTHRPSLFREAHLCAREPFLQPRKAAQFERVFLGRIELEHARVANLLALAREELRDVVGVEFVVIEDGACDRLPCLIQCQTRKCIQKGIHSARIARLHETPALSQACSGGRQGP